MISAVVKKGFILACLMSVANPLRAEESNVFSVRFLNISAGSWMSLNDETRENYLFNKLVTDVYMDIYSFEAFVGIPFSWTVVGTDSVNLYGERMYDAADTPLRTIDQAAFFGDMTIYLGKRLAIIEPRLGILIPLGYESVRAGDDNVWIGSDNVKLLAGVGINSDKALRQRLVFSGDVMFKLSVNNAKIGAGSFDIVPLVKGSIRPSPQWNIGMEIISYYSYHTSTLWGDKRVHSVGVVPALFGAFSPVPAMDIGAKIGYGSSFKTILETVSGYDVSGAEPLTSQAAVFTFSLYVSFYL
jgi:hypothetical protein